MEAVSFLNDVSSVSPPTSFGRHAPQTSSNLAPLILGRWKLGTGCKYSCHPQLARKPAVRAINRPLFYFASKQFGGSLYWCIGD